MGPFIGRRRDWKMVENSSLKKKLKAVNSGQQPVYTLYLYSYLGYYTVYKIMGLYKNYLSRLQIVVQNKFNKTIS